MKKFIFFVAAVMVSALCYGQLILNPQDQAKLDPNVRVGKLENGLTYYIRHNEMPEKRAEFYIATNVGAINETPAQRGLAHFLEHMCFNGNRDFPGNTMLPYLEKNGLTFGGNVNAMTGVEQTVYTFMDVPTTRKELVDSLIIILLNDAALVTNDFAEIEKERGVIIEEWRGGNTAQRRGIEKLYSVLYKGTKYANCNVIGDEQGLLSFDPQELVNFYKTWYYPANQAIVVVGDIDVDYIENKIKEVFNVLPKKENPPVKELIPIPGNDEPEVCLHEDKELTMTTPILIVKGEARPEEYNSMGIAILTDLTESLIVRMVNERLNDASKQPDAPFSQAGLGFNNMTKTMKATILQAVPKDNSKGMEALSGAIAVVRQAFQYGFTQAEFDRAKTSILRSYEAAVDNAPTRRNGSYAMDYVNHFLENEPYMEPAYAKSVVEQYLNLINVNALNMGIQQPQAQALTLKNSVIYYTAPQIEGVTVPTEQEIIDAYKAAMTAEVKPLENEEELGELLDPATVKGGTITKTEKGFLGSTVYTLSNGVKVIAYPTDVRKDQVNIRLVQKGGESIMPQEILPTFEDNIYSTYSGELGVGQFKENQLQKILTGKRAFTNFYLNDYASSISAGGSPKDLETIFQLLYLKYTQPRCEDAEFNNAIAPLKLVVENIESNPQFKFQKMIRGALTNNSPRRLIISKEVLDKANAADVRKAYEIYLGDAVGAQMFIVGDFTEDAIKPLIEKYIASLPVKSKKEKSFVNHKIGPAAGANDIIKSTKMENPTTYTAVVFTGDIPYNTENGLLARAYGYIMRMRYIEKLREEDGGTYTPSASADLSDRLNNKFQFAVIYQTQFEKSEGLLKKTYEQVDDIAANGPTDEEITKTVEMFKKQIAEDEKEISYYSGLLNNYYFWGDGDTRNTPERIDKVVTKENIKKFANLVKNAPSRVNVTLNPEK